jgi:hypothetical protein
MKIQKLYSDNYRAAEFQSGDVLANHATRMTIDSETFTEMFAEIDQLTLTGSLNKQSMQQFLDSKDIKIKIDDFLPILAFQIYMRKKFPDPDVNRARRTTIYMGRNIKKNYVKLSESFDLKIAECTEFSALAQLYMQHRGIKSVFISGHAFMQKDPFVAGGGLPHSYNMLDLDGVKYVYDAANPIATNSDMVLPAIMGYELTPEQRDSFESGIKSPNGGTGFHFFETHDIYDAGRTWLYGFDRDFADRRESGILRKINNDENTANIIHQKSQNDGNGGL